MVLADMLRFIIALIAALAHMPTLAASPDDAFLAAREAFRVGDAVRFERHAKSLNGHILEPYIAYWRLRLRLDQATLEEVQALLARVKDGPVSNSLRADWLRMLGMKQQWELFDAEYPLLVGEDTELLCFTLQSRLRAGGTEALHSARTLWFSGRDMPDSCNAVFDALNSNQQLTADDICDRLRLALEAGNTGVARRVAEYLPTQEQPDARALSGIAVNPRAYLDRGTLNPKTRAGRETVMFAVHRLARTSPQLAAQQWLKLGERFSDSERGYVWALVAFLAAQRLDPNALSWYAR